MKKVQLLILTILFSAGLFAQNIGINSTGATPNASAMLDVDAAPGNNKGLLIPRLSLVATNSVNPVTAPATSLLVYNIATASTGSTAVTPGYYYWDGAKWVRLQAANSGSSSTSWDVLGNAGTVDGTNFLGTTDNVPLNFRVNNRRAGRIDHNLRNSFYGYQAGNSNTTGANNVAIGADALLSNTTGSFNVANGSGALITNSVGNYNTANGYHALFFNQSGSNNVATGYDAMLNNTTGAHNTATGNGALYQNTTGTRNSALGSGGLYWNTTGNNNVSIGSSASYSNTTGNNNIAIGENALYRNQTTSFNIAIGTNALFANTTGVSNTAIGSSVLSSNTTGIANTSVGEASLMSNTTGSYNAACGTAALQFNTVGSENAAFGHGALYRNTTGNANTSAGFVSLHNNTTGNLNTAVGQGALFANTTGLGNTSMGFQSLFANTTGNNNSAFGNGALNASTTGSNNVAVGASASFSNTTGSHNNAIGYEALQYNLSGSNNTANGYRALYNVSFGNNNTAVGSGALRLTSSGEENTSIGVSTGTTNVTGHRNTLIGAFADVTAGNLVNAAAIGYNAKVAQNNALILGGTGADQVKVGIGTTTPNEQFTIENGNIQLGESLAATGLGRQLFFSDVANNAFDPIFFQRQNVSSDFSNLNLSIGDNYNAGYSNDKFNIGSGYNGSGVFNSVLTVEMGQRRVGVNTSDPVVDLQVNGSIESSGRSAATPALNHHYAQLNADGGLRLRRNPAAPTFTSSNGYIDFVNDAGTGYDFRLSYERNIGPAGSMAFADNVNTHMTIAQGTGRVGIKAFNPGGIFELGFDQGRKPATSAWTVTSDERLKTINGNYTKGLKEILQLNTITYYYKNVGNRQFQPEVLKNLNVGFSAQEVQKIFPEAVGVDDDGYLNFNMHAILVAYTNAIKEQQAQIEELKKENKEMKKNYEAILELLKK